MAKNVTRDTERLLMMQSNNKELNSAVSRIQLNNKELNLAVSRMQLQISRLKRKKRRGKAADLVSAPAPWRPAAFAQAETDRPGIMRTGHSQGGVLGPIPLPSPAAENPFVAKISPSLQSLLSPLMGSGSPERERGSRQLGRPDRQALHP